MPLLLRLVYHHPEPSDRQRAFAGIVGSMSTPEAADRAGDGRAVSTAVTGVILAAGEGRRMGPLGVERAKACLPVVGRPLLHHHLDLLTAMGVRDVVVVVGFRAAEVIAAARAYAPGVDGLALRFVEQRERRGIAHALEQARDLVGERFVVVLGDTFFVPDDLAAGLRLMAADPSGRLAAVLSIRPEPDPAAICRECSVRFDDGGRLLEIREKPAAPFNDLKPCGIYFFDRRIFEAIACTPPSALRGEVEITDAIQGLVRLGYDVGRAATVRWDSNLNVPADLLQSNLVELARRGASSWVAPEASVHPGARLERAVVCAGARVEAPARLVRTLVLEGAVVDRAEPLEDAIVGGGFALRGLGLHPPASDVR